MKKVSRDMAMALKTEEAAIAFSRPGGESRVPSRARPVDLVHLARQTLGDRALEQEVLGMFVQQLAVTRERLAAANEGERQTLAHTLKGSARSIGAFAIADCAEAIEKQPSGKTHLSRLSKLIDEVRDFIAAINRC